MTTVAQSADLLPDLSIWTDKLYDNAIDTSTMPGRTLLRLSTGTPNTGNGRLELRGGTVNANGTQNVNQRIFRQDGTWWERQAGQFTYHPSHQHIHFDGWCRYRLRQLLAGGGVGPVLATGQKTSFCILDLQVYNNQNPGYQNPGFYSGCGSVVQGLTPGWADIYSKNLTDQWIDITGIADGDYWLEAEVDPDGLILESNETNNIGRIQVHVGVPPPPTQDAYEENDTRAVVDGRSEGPNSPQLGTVNAFLQIPNLTITASDPDWYRFRMNRIGGTGDYVSITSTYTQGDIDMKLYNSSGTQIAVSESVTNNESISMTGRSAGFYYIQVYPYSGTNPGYTLKIQPSGNLPPSIVVTEPPAMMWVERSFDTIPMRWSATDPENDPMRVNLFWSRNPVFDKAAQPIPGYQNLPATDLSANVNTAETPIGLWYMYAQVTDGGLLTAQRAPGAVMLYIRGDINMDGVLNRRDLGLLGQAIRGSYTLPNMNLGDFNRSGSVNITDYNELEEHIFHDH